MHEATVSVDGIQYRCEAKAYAWSSLGVGVDVSLYRDQVHVAFVRILCPADAEEYDVIASLSEPDRVRVALERFAERTLRVTPERLLECQRKVEAVSGAGIIVIFTSFQPIAREDTRADESRRGG